MVNIGVNPLSHLVKKSGNRYRFGILVIIRHHLHMDVIKLYARSEQDVGYTENIRMSFRWDKCGPMGQSGAQCGNVTEGVALTESSHIKDSYKYLGI